MPDRASSSTSRWTSALAPTSMPRVGSSRIEDPRLGVEPLGEHHLLLVAAGEVADRGVEAGRADRERRAESLGDRVARLSCRRAAAEFV